MGNEEMGGKGKSRNVDGLYKGCSWVRIGPAARPELGQVVGSGGQHLNDRSDVTLSEGEREYIEENWAKSRDERHVKHDYMKRVRKEGGENEKERERERCVKVTFSSCFRSCESSQYFIVND